MDVVDAGGGLIFAGDTVQCATNRYPSIAFGTRRKVQRVEGGNIVLANHMSPIGTSQYNPRHFMVVKKQENKMGLHVAIRVDNRTDQNIADILHNNPHPMIGQMAETDLQALKNRVSARIQADPTERWAIMTATTIAETSAPPVRFRNL